MDDDKRAMIALGFLALGLGVWLGRIVAEADLMLQIEEFQAKGGKIIPPKNEIEISAIRIEQM